MSSVFKYARSLSGVSRLRADLLNRRLYKVIFIFSLPLDAVLNNPLYYRQYLTVTPSFPYIIRAIP
jgi:hypothetical protein